MITVLPMENTERQAQLLQNYPGHSENARILWMQDGEEALGYVAVDCVGETLYLLALCVGKTVNPRTMDMEESFIADFLMRSAASYGEYHGMRKIETTFATMNEFFRSKGFSVDFSHAFTPMETIVKIKKPGEEHED